MSKCNCWRNQTHGAEFQEGDKNCMSSAIATVGPVVANVYLFYLALAELYGLAELLTASIFLAFRWILILLYPDLCCSKMWLIAAIIMWSVETCSDWFSVQLFRTHLSGWCHIFCARVTILQLQNNSSEVVKINWISSPSWSLHGRVSSELQDLDSPEFTWIPVWCWHCSAVLAGRDQSWFLTVWSREALSLPWPQFSAVFLHGMLHNSSVFAWVNSSEMLPVLAP